VNGGVRSCCTPWSGIYMGKIDYKLSLRGVGSPTRCRCRPADPGTIPREGRFRYPFPPPPSSSSSFLFFSPATRCTLGYLELQHSGSMQTLRRIICSKTICTFLGPHINPKAIHPFSLETLGLPFAADVKGNAHVCRRWTRRR
jgi:hypothetical protein